MAGDVANLTTENALLQDSYERPAADDRRRPKRKKKKGKKRAKKKTSGPSRIAQAMAPTPPPISTP